jgi:hypothetical protein
MALTPRSGSIVAPSVQTDSQSKIDVTDVLNQPPFIQDITRDRTAFNPITFSDEFSALQGYVYGSRVTCIYFWRQVLFDNRQSDAIDFSNVRNLINQNYICINNYEITIITEIEMIYNEAISETTINAEAVLYPGLTPNLADVFTFALSNGQYALCKITATEPLSIRQGRMHKIKFTVQKYASAPDVQILVDSSVRQVEFDKETYLTQAYTLLESSDYNYLLTLRTLRPILIKYYYSNFYNSGTASVMGPTPDTLGTYDPYLNKFLNAKISIEDTVVRSTQLPVKPNIYARTIWSRLLDRNNTAVADLWTQWVSQIKLKHYTDVYINGLLNKYTVNMIGNSTAANVTANPTEFDQGDNYVFSQNFYSGNVTDMTALEALVYSVIQTKSIPCTVGNTSGVFALINIYLNTYQSLSLDDAYYLIPIYLYLLDTGISTLTHGSKGINAFNTSNQI